VSPAERAERAEVSVAGRTLSLSNLDKVLYPATGFTKGQIVDYYARIAPVMLPHLARRPITLKRYPNGVESKFFFEKNCPSHRPPWVSTHAVVVEEGRRTVNFCLIEETAALVWTANLAAIELHPGLAVVEDLRRPTVMVFDLDPGPPAGLTECAEVALLLRESLSSLGLTALAKTSGSKGMQVYVPLNSPVDYEETRSFSLALAQVLEKQRPDLVVTNMSKELRPRKIFIDWSQNSSFKTTIAVYSLRARDRPTVSTPVTWEELESDPENLRFEAGDVLERVDAHGDLFGAVLQLEQHLPRLG
jgi:bifunctional non-homologous end joining protein LigD